eukprot:m.11605 g.11605  ORF g.11605 m.11605 type:complete len:357 (-) comp8888_c0_seq1:267-1337(-)
MGLTNAVSEIAQEIDHLRIKKIVQIGSPRSATTLQFYTLCAIAVVKYGTERVTCTYNGHNTFNINDNRIHVIKTHGESAAWRTLQPLKEGEGAIFQSMVSDSTDVEEIVLGDGPLTAKVVASEWATLSLKKKTRFITTMLAWHANKTSGFQSIQTPYDAGMADRLSRHFAGVRDFPISVSYIQYVSNLRERGSSLALEYQPIFGLTDEQMAMVVEYVHLWIPIRVCCGLQMSQHKRAWLFDPNDSEKLQSICQHGNNDFEATFLKSAQLLHLIKNQTTVHTHVDNHTCSWPAHLHALLKPSVGDPGVLNGTYCDAYDAEVRRHHHLFNQPGKEDPWIKAVKKMWPPSPLICTPTIS